MLALDYLEGFFFTVNAAVLEVFSADCVVRLKQEIKRRQTSKRDEEESALG